jgi:hypothetical protein
VPSAEAEQEARTISLGLAPAYTLLAALCLVAVALADGLSRLGRSGGEVVFWAAIFVCAAAFAVRLCGPRPSRVERLALVTVFGAWLYGVKLFRDPTGFTYADELVHQYNVDAIVAHHGLFAPNPILPLTPRYPGLEAATAALHDTGMLSTFGAGILMIGAARLLTMLVLFLLFERVSGSSRVAGLAAIVYTANADFVFFDGEFSYESLALPLAFLASYTVLRWLWIREDAAETEVAPFVKRLAGKRNKAPAEDVVQKSHEPSLGWGVATILASCAVVVTHHASAYLLILFILAIGRAQRELKRRSPQYVSPFPFAVFALVAVLAWVLFMARSTWSYLFPLVSQAVGSALDTIAGHQASRQLFAGGTAGSGPPIWDRSVAVMAALLTLLGILVGARQVWKNHRSNSAYLVLGCIGSAYLVTLGLRLVPSAWELANRASEFLFIGVGLLLAVAVVETNGGRFLKGIVGALAVGAAFGILVEGGVVSGWSSNLVLGQTFEASAGSATLHPEGVTAADWARRLLGPNRRFAADASNARLLAAYGHEFAIAGTNPDVRSVIRDPRIDGWHIRLLRRNGIRYVLVDRRRVSEDALAGYFMNTATTPRAWLEQFPVKDVHKFDRQPDISRLYDSGDIVIYDFERLVGGH